jgi:hypothetical protein
MLAVDRGAFDEAAPLCVEAVAAARAVEDRRCLVVVLDAAGSLAQRDATSKRCGTSRRPSPCPGRSGSRRRR